MLAWPACLPCWLVRVTLMPACLVVATFVASVLIAGHETVGAMLAWTVLELGEHPEVLAKLRAELDQALGQPGGGEEEEEGRRLLELVEGGSSLPYLECVMKESLRLHPPVTVFSRGTTRVRASSGLLLVRHYTRHGAGRASG